MRNKSELITSNFEILGGKPVVAKTRISVELILRKMAEGADKSDIKAMYPSLTDEHIFAALEYAANMMANEELIEVS